jgi:DNA-binding LytR/AlgR family response regulator
MNLRAIVVDDEPLAVKRIQIALRRIGGVELLGTASDGVKALELISTCSPDLILLDIKMPLMNGFDLLRALGGVAVPEVIFITAYGDFALAAFEAGAVGYVLKPIGEDRLRIAVERARAKLKSRDAEERLASLSALLEKLQRSEPPSKIAYEQELWIHSGSTIERVAVQDVDWFEAAGDYVAVHCGRREYLLHDSLRSLIERLDPAEFIRVHRKAIVRLEAVSAVTRERFDALILEMGSGDRVRVSRTYKQSLKERTRIGAQLRATETAPLSDQSKQVGEK